MWILCIKKFLRTSVAQIGLSALLIAGIISLFIGRQHLVKYQTAVKKTTLAQEEHINRNKAFFSADLGLLFYYLKFSLVNEPDPLNGINIGQRDVNPSIQSVTIRNLENQRYDTDLFNPAGLHAGNLDLSFVLLYLFPLLIIAFCYSVLSADKEAGTWNMTRIQSGKPTTLIWINLGVRMGFVFALFFLLLGLGFLFLPLLINASFFVFAGIAMAYLLFWFGICSLVITFNRGSGTNAMILLSCWILLTIVLPSAANNYLIAKYPVPEAMSTMVEQREAYHEKWDMEKTPTLRSFYKVYPEYAKYGFPEENFTWLWYYAMQHMGDEDAKGETSALFATLSQRDNVTKKISYFIPTLHVQYQFNELAKAGLSNQLLFLKETAHFHASVRKYSYPLIFEDKNVDAVDWARLNVQKFSEPYQTKLIVSFLPVVLITGILFILSSQRINSIS
jgi:ABC-2 type transport system permease protein